MILEPDMPAAHLTQDRYDRVTIAFHWLTALLVVVLFGTAFAWNYLPREWHLRSLEGVHVSLGIALATVLVGHVTKEGAIAGPRLLEHMVDCVLYFEGERHHSYRLLRAVKNRFGSTNEIGIFDMTEGGLREVTNPSELFLSERPLGVAGSTVVASMEGTRPVLVEVQALTVRLASGATPRRAVVGWDSGRLAMVLAVLEARCGLQMGAAEVYLNVAGGYRLTDPAADLAVAAALISAFSERPEPADAIVFGELSLSGEIRPVVDAPTATFANFECHVTTLRPREPSHAPHQHADEEIVIVKEGTLEITINGQPHRAPAGSVVFIASNDHHGLRNGGDTTAIYHVLRIVAPAP